MLSSNCTVVPHIDAAYVYNIQQCALGKQYISVPLSSFKQGRGTAQEQVAGVKILGIAVVIKENPKRETFTFHGLKLK